MKVIFLDIDGVLVNRESLQFGRSGSHASAHPDCVSALNRILITTGAHIVISSVWRMYGLIKMRDILSSWGVVKDRILDCTPILKGDWERGEEIQLWLKKNDHNLIESIVILDDDNDMGNLKDKLIQTKFKPGLTEQNATQAIEVLNKKR